MRVEHTDVEVSEMGWIMVLGLAVLLCLSPIWTVDSRDGRDWSPARMQPNNAATNSAEIGCIVERSAPRMRGGATVVRGGSDAGATEMSRNAALLRLFRYKPSRASRP